MSNKEPKPETFFSGELLPIAQAIKSNDIDRAKELSKNLDNIDKTGFENFTLLAFSVADSNAAAIHMLMELGADPAHQIGRHKDRGTIGSFSMWNRSTEALRALLESGMDPDQRETDRTLIYKVPELRDNDSLKLLVEFGADVNARDRLGQTPLFDFINVSFDEALYLLDHGADPFVMDRSGMTTAYSVQDELNNMDKSTEAYQKMLTIQQKMIDLGVKFPALTPYGERFRNDIVYCKEPRGYRPRSECKVEGVNRFLKPQSEESKLADEKILRERYGIDAKL
ncbi:MULTISPECIES: ankyrin repeat domain-containing protein [Vibrio]|uniref:ankyrin repeat domain-containing protein n=1 Tax=Vibrio TaxID=662 RepID=UPI0005F1B08B|nr:MULTISPECIES: ankyrin repeat domain-containing protein [Vibrio]EGR1513883.1 ankyrin repeat domain-containing protein [Vibrio vulnificus]EHH2450155.1 ankyrin repeat domain-containing protein [Vibrio vulnificus]EIZ4668304.1 ankyrin repeat domain-containing protein [Vibrio vulnificus]HDY7690753.1 ankyrin repeat domain-containing protein [Vibrio vulnificus]HDY7805716.1 ankyrin repeat domain-containing protein [Vibrio vulnificus]